MNRQFRRMMERGIAKIAPKAAGLGEGRIGAIMGEVERRLAGDGKAAPSGLLEKIAADLETARKGAKRG